MEINSYSNNIQSFVGVQAGTLEKIGSALAINSASDDASGLAIADALDLQEGSLSQSVANYNSGIAMSNIAQDGIESQKEILENMRTETLKAMNGTTSESDRQIIADQLSKYVEQYEQVASTTTYNGQSLLTISGDSTDDMSIVGESSIIELSKADTTSISDTLKSYISDFATNPDSQKALLEAIDKGLTQLDQYASEYGSASNAMESSARNAISTATNTAKAESTVMDIDYAKEVSDFSKTNLMSQIAILVQSQSNAVQARTVPLLS